MLSGRAHVHQTARETPAEPLGMHLCELPQGCPSTSFNSIALPLLRISADGSSATDLQAEQELHQSLKASNDLIDRWPIASSVPHAPLHDLPRLVTFAASKRPFQCASHSTFMRLNCCHDLIVSSPLERRRAVAPDLAHHNPEAVDITSVIKLLETEHFYWRPRRGKHRGSKALLQPPQ